jgi:hypothetical protein
MSSVTRLERRYRRLLAWFPAEHRNVYGEEMIGVLMASASEGEDRPSTAAAVDLIGGGLRARLGRLRTGDGNQHWRHALAVFSVIAPFLLFFQLAVVYLNMTWTGPGARDSSLAMKFAVLTMLIASAIALAAVAIGPALARRGHNATVTAIAVIGAVIASAGAIQAYLVWGYHFYWLPSYFTLIFIIEVVALVASPGPGRGWDLLGRNGLIILAVGAAALVAAGTLDVAATLSHGQTVTQIAPRTYVVTTTRWMLTRYGQFISEVSPVACVIALLLPLRWRTGLRLLALWAIPSYLLSGYDAVTNLFPQLQTATANLALRYLPVVAIAVLVALAAWSSSRRSGSATPSG